MNDEELDEQAEVDDWNDQIDLLPEQPRSIAEQKYIRLFSLDVACLQSHDQYVYIVPNGLCIVGLAPTHPVVFKGLKWASEHHNDNDCEIRFPGSDICNEIKTGCSGGQDGPSGSSTAVNEMDIVGGNLNELVERDLKEHVSSNHKQICADVISASNDRLGDKQPQTHTQLKRVNFDIGRRSASTKQSGKKKFQGSFMDANSVLCKLEMEDGSSIAVRSVTSGKLLEVNEKLVERPDLLLQRPLREGFIAIVFPNEAQRSALIKNLVSAGKYCELRGLTMNDLSK